MRTSWPQLLDEVYACEKCRLCATRTNVVPGEGNPSAELMFIGEGPGRDEDLQGRPFVGRSGELLTRMIRAIGLEREQVYICNVVKCRPPQNRDPLNVEQDACLSYLRRQAALLRPKIIVCLGRIAAKAIIKEDFKITVEHGQWFQRGGVQMTAIYHPAALLREEGRRPETFEDLKSIQEKIRELCEHTDVTVPAVKS